MGFNPLLEIVKEVGAVIQTGQRIVVSQLFETILQFNLFCDVPDVQCVLNLWMIAVRCLRDNNFGRKFLTIAARELSNILPF